MRYEVELEELRVSRKRVQVDALTDLEAENIALEIMDGTGDFEFAFSKIMVGYVEEVGEEA